MPTRVTPAPGASQVMLLVYCGMCLWHRDKLIPLQLGVACVMLLGLVEVCTWFFTYTSKNASGVPVCDADDSCPPLTDDIMAAAVLSVGKRCVSRVLLLVVCLGYGVVKPKLSRGNAVLVALLGCVLHTRATTWPRHSISYHLEAADPFPRRVLPTPPLSLGYFGFGTVLAMIEANAPDDLGTSMWAVPVVIFDLVFVCWIYQALETIRVQLRQANQPVRCVRGRKVTSQPRVDRPHVRPPTPPTDRRPSFRCTTAWDLRCLPLSSCGSSSRSS